MTPLPFLHPPPPFSHLLHSGFCPYTTWLAIQQCQHIIYRAGSRESVTEKEAERKNTHKSKIPCTLGSAKSRLTRPSKLLPSNVSHDFPLMMREKEKTENQSKTYLTSASPHPKTPVHNLIDRPSSPFKICSRFHPPTSLSVGSRGHGPIGTRKRLCVTFWKPAAVTHPSSDEPGLGLRPSLEAAWQRVEIHW